MDAYWYKPPHDHYPRVFISELKVKELSTTAQDIIYSYTKEIQKDPIGELNLNDAQAVVDFLHQALKLPSLYDYKTLLNESNMGRG